MDKLKNIRTVLTFEGIIAIILGALAVALPGLFTLGVELFIGWILLIAGFIGIIRSFTIMHTPGFSAALAASIVYLVFGILLVAFPVTGILSMTILTAIFFIFSGIGQIVFAFQSKQVQGWVWFLFSGLISLGMAAIIIFGFPGTAAWVIGLLVGINLIFFGFAMLAIAANMPPKPET